MQNMLGYLRFFDASCMLTGRLENYEQVRGNTFFSKVLIFLGRNSPLKEAFL
jgi:hypothetical protein